MGSKAAFILMGIALVVIGGGVVLMTQLGGGPDSYDDLSQESGQEKKVSKGRYEDNPLTPTATFNVSQKLDSGVNLITEIAQLADGLNDPSVDPVEDLNVVGEIIGFHTRMFNSVPGGGENVDIMSRLTGGNTRQIALISPDHPAINERGELEDRWGTPYHFHQLSRRELEIRSAGPDKALWTDDDVLIEDEGQILEEVSN